MLELHQGRRGAFGGGGPEAKAERVARVEPVNSASQAEAQSREELERHH